ncbi:MAG: NUDIX domain-containing protein [Bacteroidales bacterium]|jgi:8-oxo-dGTP pyrophosphatase MutT (NUDIX family)|nr:NUDIX domain-containing protein [Bacteroidales bacterium]
MTREIFYIDKKLSFTNTVIALEQKKNASEIVFSNIYQLIRLFEKHFISDKSDKDVNVIVPKKFNVDEVFTQFINCFTIINASGGLVHTPNDEYLYIYRNDRWDLPKGHKERKEKKETTALREVREETGVSNASIVKQLPSTYHFLMDNGEFKVKETHWFEILSPTKVNTVPQKKENIKEAVFLSKEEVFEKIPLMYSSIAQLTRKFFDGRD